MNAIGMNSVSAYSITLLGEDVLVKAMPSEEMRTSGLVIPHAARESFGKGSEFYGTVVSMGPGRLVERIVEDKRIKLARVPMPWQRGDHVLCRQGFGPEIELWEGRHHIVGRGNAQHGHGIIAAWNPGHVHCWHLDHEKRSRAECACGERKRVETRLPSCSCCPDGERLAEASLGAEIYNYKAGRDAPAGDYELKPEGGEGHEV